ncbi:tRNA (guanosine(46)-N7)-methyltransferase TrmB [Virgibacillus ndiopensis]|uniref:tRNA (guanosine(46)-N7)-methyltransferase TrmB n=1 Tax=Virgibacillus ndiopensis TaxID=2004408 RepID=UPI000C070387|nr:tRNA (guanosine(46)-N7)-methyltransferase TrmB [Virgibacillus ndiopensis]
MRQRNKPWADDFLENNSHIVIPDSSINKSKWKSVFNNENPIHVEIGTGKGQFLVGMAKQFPNVNFIGIELAKSIIVTAAQKVKAAELDNILLINENASDLREIFADDEISTIYLNFSDPWPKNRHEKRRLTFHTFLEQYRHVMKDSSELVMKTDNRGLFEYSLVSFSKFGMRLEEVNLDLHQAEDPTNVMTEYEQKFSEKGQVIYRCKTRFN